MINEELKHKIQELAHQFETEDFIRKDPSQFMHNYSDARDQEAVAFLSANLAFGRRDQILKHIEIILNRCNSSPSNWILNEEYKSLFTKGNESFYRVYTHNHMIRFFDTLKKMLAESSSIGFYIEEKYKMSQANGMSDCPYLHQVISSVFPKECALIPHGKDSAAKKVNMMLRWLVRDNSPVDLGLWTWYDKRNLLMPLDTHVMQEATNFGILERTAAGKIQAASLKTAVLLTDRMKEIFPDDPLKGDFALFGLGVSE